MPVQVDYGRYPEKGYLGDVARPAEPFAFDLGLAHVPTSGRKPRPGDAVYYDTTANGFAVPTTAAQRTAVIGIVSYDPGVVSSTLASAPTDANSDQFVEFYDDDPIKICVFGTVWVRAGSAMEYGQVVQQDTYSTPDYKWDPYTPDLSVPNTFADLAAARAAVFAVVENSRSRVFECVNPTPVADSDLVQVRIGYGRIV